jgi:hypothetical protein
MSMALLPLFLGSNPESFEKFFLHHKCSIFLPRALTKVQC